MSKSPRDHGGAHNVDCQHGQHQHRLQVICRGPRGRFEFKTSAFSVALQKLREKHAFRDVHNDHAQPNKPRSFPGPGRAPEVARSQRIDHGEQAVHADKGDEDGAGSDVVVKEHRDPDAGLLVQRPGARGVEVDPHGQRDDEQQV